MVELLSHIGILVKSVDAAAKQWGDRYGFGVVDEIVSEVDGVRSLFLALPGAGEHGSRIELIEPLRPDDVSHKIARRLAEQGEGFFHIALRIDAPSKRAESLREMGVRVIDLQPFREGESARAIVHPADANGVLLELM